MSSSFFNINGKAKEDYTFDAIVIGSGISGGWAAKEFCEKGLKTLVWDRGRLVEHLKCYTSTNVAPWDSRQRILLPKSLKDGIPNLSRSYASQEDPHNFIVHAN